MKFLKSHLQGLLLGITISICILGISVLFAWTEPSSNPPEGNVPGPINISNTGQSKSGGLILNTGGASIGLVVDKGDVGIGTTNPGYKLGVIGKIHATDDVCTDLLGGRCLSSATSQWITTSGNNIYFGIGNSMGEVTTNGVTRTTTCDGAYTIDKFTYTGSPGSTNWVVPSGVTEVEYLVVGAGGGTPISGAGVTQAGGGGAGEFVTNFGGTKLPVSGTIIVTVGAGVSGDNGQDSVFGTITAKGGGKGGKTNSNNGSNGGSGGGGADISGTGGNSTATPPLGFGNHGGAGGNNSGGGGGGAGAPGSNGSSDFVSNGGDGGIGKASSITGSSVYYAGGGGGGSYYATTGKGGTGGGGTQGDGLANTGGGAGVVGGATHTGGSGIVILRYLMPGSSCPAPYNSVGIGTNSPTQRLEVNGNILANGNVLADDDVCNGQGKCLSNIQSIAVSGTNPTCPSGQSVIMKYDGTHWVGETDAPSWTAVFCSVFVNDFPLVAGVHRSSQCVIQGGQVVDDGLGNKMCRFNASACPDTWPPWTQYQDWSTTRTGCQAGYTACGALTSHSWANTAREAYTSAFYTYRYGLGCDWLNRTVCNVQCIMAAGYSSGFVCINQGFQYAAITQIGCY
jgi:hypothetical protein